MSMNKGWAVLARIGKKPAAVKWADRQHNLRVAVVGELGRFIKQNPELTYVQIARMHGVPRAVVGLAAKLRGIEPKLGLAHPRFADKFRPAGKSGSRGRIKWLPKRGVCVKKGWKLVKIRKVVVVKKLVRK